MASDPTSYRLADVARITSGKRPPSSVKVATKEAFVPIVGGGGVSGFTNQALFVDPVLITGRVGTLGKLFAIDGPSWPSDNALVVIANEDKVDRDFLRYALQTVISGTVGMNRGAANPLVTQADLGILEIPRLPFEMQKKTAGVLRTIDDRIDNLRQTNTTLEAIAQALFKSWFVDFDPVHAKAEGREPEGMDATTAALFPSEFEDSELGLIPKGWHIKRLGDVCRLTWGNTSMTKKSYVAEGVKAFSAAGQDGFVEVGERNGIGSVISAIGTVGVVHLAFGQWTAIKNTLVAQCDTDVESSWLHHLLKTIRFPARGSTQQFISQTDARNVKVILPPLAVRNEYGETCVALISKMEALQRQVRSLDQLRDTLLPRLISGRLRIPDAEREIEAATA